MKQQSLFDTNVSSLTTALNKEFPKPAVKEEVVYKTIKGSHVPYNLPSGSKQRCVTFKDINEWISDYKAMFFEVYEDALEYYSTIFGERDIFKMS